MATQGSLQNASQAAKDQANGILREATSGVGEFAGALRNAAKQIDGGQNPTTARLATQAADALERMSSTLRSNDLDSMLRETERFARSQPALFIGAAALAGFLAVRFLKSSSPDKQGDLDAPDFRP
jgi:hypothetical protein